MSDFQQYSTPVNGGVWKAIATGLGGLVVGLLLAWFAAFQRQGVTQVQLEDYVAKHSPYIFDKQAISDHNATQDKEIGRISGRQEQVIDRLGKIEITLNTDEREMSEIRTDVKTKMDIVASLLEQQKKRP